MYGRDLPAQFPLERVVGDQPTGEHHRHALDSALSARERVQQHRGVTVHALQPVEGRERDALVQHAMHQRQARAVLGTMREIEMLADVLDGAALVREELGDGRCGDMPVEAAHDDRSRPNRRDAAQHVEPDDNVRLIDSHNVGDQRAPTGRDHHGIGSELEHDVCGHLVTE